MPMGMSQVPMARPRIAAASSAAERPPRRALPHRVARQRVDGGGGHPLTDLFEQQRAVGLPLTAENDRSGDEKHGNEHTGGDLD